MTFNAPEEKHFENILEKGGENVGNQHFLLTPQCFLLCERHIACFELGFRLSSTNALKFCWPKILLSCKRLTIPNICSITLSNQRYSLLIPDNCFYQDNNVERGVEWIFSHPDELESPMETEEQISVSSTPPQCRDGNGSKLFWQTLNWN